MLQKTAHYMKQKNMAAQGEKIVIGLSGGVDSVCLLYVLKDLGFSLEAVHVNHGIRGAEADRDEEFAKVLCERLEVPFHLYKFNVPAMSKEQHLSCEEAGRIVRRQAFEEVMAKTGAARIALAHHGNDRAETFLFHLSRGTGIKGLSAMKPVDGVYIRPFLWADRKELEAYAKARAYEFVEDSTNQSVCYTRNKIRHEILPVLEVVNSKTIAHICGAAEKLSEVSSYIDREAQKLFEKGAKCSEKCVELNKKILYENDTVLHIPVIQKCLEYVSGSLADVGEEHFRMIRELFEKQTGKEVVLPAKMLAVRSYEGVRFCLQAENILQTPVKIEQAGEYFFAGHTFRISIEAWDERKNFPINHYTKCFDYDKISGDIFLRTRFSGDYLEINQDHGKKTLQDYLVNEKVPKNHRDRLVLLAEGNHILWVVGKRISEYYKVTKETKKVLKVQVCGGNIYE